MPILALISSAVRFLGHKSRVWRVSAICGLQRRKGSLVIEVFKPQTSEWFTLRLKKY
jgi:hypothetical protein